MSYETILFDVADHVATITINRPEAMNSFNRQMMEEFEAVWHEVKWNDDIHVCVLRYSPMMKSMNSGTRASVALPERASRGIT